MSAAHFARLLSLGRGRGSLNSVMTHRQARAGASAQAAA